MSVFSSNVLGGYRNIESHESMKQYEKIVGRFSREN